MDITKILSYGVIGLGFLLALLSYRLLFKEQANENPRRSILNAIYIFMAFSIVLTLIGLTSELKKSLSFQGKETAFRSSPEQSKYYLGIWKGKAIDIINNRIGDTVQEKYSYDLTIEFKIQNDSIKMTGSYNATPMNKSTPQIPTRIMEGYAIQNEDFLRVLYFTKAEPQPTGRGIGVFCFRFSPTGTSADGYSISRGLKDGEYVVGKLQLER